MAVSPNFLCNGDRKQFPVCGSQNISNADVVFRIYFLGMQRKHWINLSIYVDAARKSNSELNCIIMLRVNIYASAEKKKDVAFFFSFNLIRFFLYFLYETMFTLLSAA